MKAPPRRFFPLVTFVIVLLAFLVRFLHNGALLESPLYYHPRGGHLPYLLLAEDIARGNLWPFGGVITVSSPGYPYAVAVVYALFGIHNFFALRLVTILLDTLTVFLVIGITRERFGEGAALIAGGLAALYIPLIFYSAELLAVSFTVCLLTAGVAVLLSQVRFRGFLSGLLLGLAVSTRPNLLPALILFLTALFFTRNTRTALAFLLGASLPILPFTVGNCIRGGECFVLSATGAHNLFIAHNPNAQVGYSLPTKLDGDIHESMKELAEEELGRSLTHSETARFYRERVWEYLQRFPLEATSRIMARVKASLGDAEATTYADLTYTQYWSPWIRLGTRWGIVFPFAIFGILLIILHRAWSKSDFYLLTPIAVSLALLSVFFFISRLRMPAVPFLCVYAGYGVSQIVQAIGSRKYKSLSLAVAVILPYLLLFSFSPPATNSSNEWTKAGVVLREQNDLKGAEQALLRAREIEPQNQCAYKNLILVYRNQGRETDALRMEEKLRELEANAEMALRRYRTLE